MNIEELLEEGKAEIFASLLINKGGDKNDIDYLVGAKVPDDKIVNRVANSIKADKNTKQYLQKWFETYEKPEEFQKVMELYSKREEESPDEAAIDKIVNSFFTEEKNISKILDQLLESEEAKNENDNDEDSKEEIIDFSDKYKNIKAAFKKWFKEAVVAKNSIDDIAKKLSTSEQRKKFIETYIDRFEKASPDIVNDKSYIQWKKKNLDTSANSESTDDSEGSDAGISKNEFAKALNSIKKMTTLQKNMLRQTIEMNTAVKSHSY